MNNRSIGKRLLEHRQLVHMIAFKTSLLVVVRDRLARLSGSVIMQTKGNPDATISNIQMIDDLAAEIAALNEQRRCERAELDALVKRLDSELQRQVIESYYFCGLSWREVADVIYGRSHEKQKNSCRAARGKAIFAMDSIRFRK